MTDNPDFDLDAAWLDPAAASAKTPPPGPAVAPEPVVVIQYRSRGLPPFLMLPIALVGTLALLVGYHNYAAPAARPADPMPPPATPAPVAELDDSVARAAADALARNQAPLPLPLTLEGRPLPHEEPTPAPPPVPVVANPATPGPGPAEPEPAPEGRPPISIASASPVFAAPAQPEPAPEPEPAPDAVERPGPPADAPLPTQEEMMERIRQEAELKAIQRAEMERRRAEDMERLKVEAVQRVEQERDEFRHRLRAILKANPPDAGRAVEDLCDQFGRACDPAARERATAILSYNKGKLTSEAEIHILRRLGLPEPVVLDFLCNRLNRSLHARGGPRSPDEARVLAARQLLRIPPIPTAAPVETATATTAPPSPSPARSPVYRRSAR